MEDKAYYTYDEAMEYLGVKRSTMYTLVTTYDIPARKFIGDKHRYITTADVMRLKEIREKPWLGKERATS